MYGVAFLITLLSRYPSVQLNIKKNAAAREAALKEQKELPRAIYVPLPVWKETKERIRLQMDVTRRSFHDKSREWENKEKVRLYIKAVVTYFKICGDALICAPMFL